MSKPTIYQNLVTHWWWWWCAMV